MSGKRHPTHKRWASSTRASSAVEFALISPLFILLLFGMVAYGIYLGASHSVQQMAADAARAAVAGLDASERQAIVSRYIDAHGSGYPLVDPAKLSIVAADDPAGDGVQLLELRVGVARERPEADERALPLPGRTIVKRSVVRIGGM